MRSNVQFRDEYIYRPETKSEPDANDAMFAAALAMLAGASALTIVGAVALFSLALGAAVIALGALAVFGVIYVLAQRGYLDASQWSTVAAIVACFALALVVGAELVR